MDPKDNQAEYALELAKRQGVSVATVKDGWLFTITEGMLQSLLDKAKESKAGMAVLFVKSSADVPATEQN